MNIAQRFVQTAQRVPHRTFLVNAANPVERLSYERVLVCARAFAAHLTAMGIAPGDRIVLNCPNSVHYVCAYFGAWLAGCTTVPLDSRSRPQHIIHVYRDCGARGIIVSAPNADLDQDMRQIVLASVDWNAA